MLFDIVPLDLVEPPPLETLKRKLEVVLVTLNRPQCPRPDGEIRKEALDHLAEVEMNLRFAAVSSGQELVQDQVPSLFGHPPGYWTQLDVLLSPPILSHHEVKASFTLFGFVVSQINVRSQ